jgi:hypothetical protein
MTNILRGAAMSLALAASPNAFADATLSLQRVGSGPVLPGQQVHVAVQMSNIPVATPAAGFQAFLRFNTSQMSFVSGTYTINPFGLHILTPIVAVGPNINLASGINQAFGQSQTAADSVLAILTFQANTVCGLAAVDFRDTAPAPPTRLTDQFGQPILPLVLLNLNTVGTCAADVEPNNAVDVLDLLQVINTWGPCPPGPLPACCAGEIIVDGSVNVLDLLAVINTWGPCP